MEDFKKKGGALMGSEERKDRVEGCPPDQFNPHGASHKAQDSVVDSSAVPQTTRSSS